MRPCTCTPQFEAFLTSMEQDRITLVRAQQCAVVLGSGLGLVAPSPPVLSALGRLRLDNLFSVTTAVV